MESVLKSILSIEAPLLLREALAVIPAGLALDFDRGAGIQAFQTFPDPGIRRGDGLDNPIFLK